MPKGPLGSGLCCAKYAVIDLYSCKTLARAVDGMNSTKPSSGDVGRTLRDINLINLIHLIISSQIMLIYGVPAKVARILLKCCVCVPTLIIKILSM